MKAQLITYGKEEIIQTDIVEIDDDHDFASGPYQDSIPFAVGSNQNIVPINDENS